MPDEELEQREDNEPGANPSEEEATAGRRPFFTKRNALIALGLGALAAVLIAVTGIFLYRGGVADTYIKAQFVSKMADIGIDFSADVFRVTVAPLRLELKNATFNDRVSGEKLFFIRDAQLGLTVQNLYAWQLSRDISIDTTDISGAEVWVRFDENGRSNFSNLKLVEEQPGRVNFKYESVVFALRDSVVHFGDVSRKIAGDANNVVFLLQPENIEVPADQRRYRFDLGSTQSRFVYDEHPLEPIDLRAVGVADRNGADITEFRLTTPIGTSSLTGRLTDWAELRYDLNIESTVDLTQASSIFPLGTPITGIGNFKGKVAGSGETYRIEGAVDSQSLTAEGIYLRGVNVTATVEGTNENYTANGNAVAELLTFEDFRIEFPKLAGNVRGTGTDFRWVGELQAVAAKTRALTLGGLFLSDAVAEYKDREFTASAGTARAQKFSVKDTEFAALTARNLRFSKPGDTVNLDIESASASSLTNKNFKLNDVRGRSLRIRDVRERTDVDVNGVQARSAEVRGNRVDNLTADGLKLIDLPGSTELTATNVRAARVNTDDGTVIDDVRAPEVSITDTPAEARVYADNLRVAKIDAGSAVLGSLNIAGVRLTMRQGRIEGTTNDIDAGNVTLTKTSALPAGGSLNAVRIAKPVFVLEPSGRYRASADMSLGGGIIGSIPLGAATAKVVVNNNGAELNNLSANVMEGTVIGNATVAFNNRSRSVINADFNNLDLGKIAALQSGRVMPLEGNASGRVDLSFAGTDYRSTTGTINATITAAAGREGTNKIPINGIVNLAAANGLFTVDQARLTAANSELTATGRFDLRNDDSNLSVALRSSNADEILNIARVTGISQEFESQIDSMEIVAGGNLSFDGTITGNLTDPTIEGKASLASLSMRGRDLGALTADIIRSPLQTEFRNGRLQQADGGLVAFNVTIPSAGTNNISVNAELTGVNAGNLLAALPVTLPERLRDFNGKTSGTVALTGLPDNSNGEVNISSEAGTIAGQPFDSLAAKAVFSGTRINIERGEIRVGAGAMSATGFYDTASSGFDLNVTGQAVPLPLLLAALPTFKDQSPPVSGTADFTARAAGEFDRPPTINVNFNGTAANVLVSDRPLGTVTFQGTTSNQILTAELVATLENRPQTINATLNFGDDNLPFRVQTRFDQSPLGPFIALIPQLSGISIEGVGTGQVEFGGNIAQRDANGNTVYSAAGLTGSARFSQLALRLQDTPISAVEPVVVRFDTREIVFESARFAGSGSNLTIAGTKALVDTGINNLSINGRINLTLLNVIPQVAAGDNFFGGFANVAIRLAGPETARRLSGTATLDNASFATFIGSDRLTFDRLQGEIRFTSNQVQVDHASGFLGGGQFVASGGLVLNDDLRPESFRFDLTGDNITVPLPEDFITTGDAKLEISGLRRVRTGALSTLIAGSILARRSVYTKDIDLASLVSGRSDTTLSSSGSSSFRAPRFDLIIEGRDALVVRNNVADLTASVSLRLAGTTENPQVSGRITANSGTVFFRKDRYIVQRGVLEFPPNTEVEPIINLQAESEIAGYQIFVNLNGPLTDTENLSATVRSSPALPQADVISLITTGNLSNTESGIPTIAQTGINTAAEILADTIINNPARKATDKLFGLNVFEIDPIISGQRMNASARLTVGRQINNNLRVTYSTNLSQDQNQVLALEYRVSNKLSFVAQYEQRSLTNVTQDRNAFSFEVRFRRRF